MGSQEPGGEEGCRIVRRGSLVQFESSSRRSQKTHIHRFDCTQVLPFIIPLTYFLLLPATSKFAGMRSSSAAYAAIPTADPTAEEDEGDETDSGSEQFANADSAVTPTDKQRTPVITLTFADKVKLVTPLLLKFMLPLCGSFLLCPTPSEDSQLTDCLPPS